MRKVKLTISFKPRVAKIRARLRRPVPVPRLAFPGDTSAAVTAAPVVMPAADLLARQVLRDGELILLIRKPSRWYILLSCLRFIAGIVAVLCLLQLWQTPQLHLRYYIDAGVFAISSRLMFATIAWMGRLYVLTNQRVMRFAGVFHVDVMECPLRKIGRTGISHHISERLLGLGTIDIRPQDSAKPCISWQTVGQPRVVREQIESAMRNVKE